MFHFCLSSFSETHLPTSTRTPILQIFLKTQLWPCLPFIQLNSRWSLYAELNILTNTFANLYLIAHSVIHAAPWPRTIRHHLSAVFSPHTPLFLCHAFVHCDSLFGIPYHPFLQVQSLNHQTHDELWSQFWPIDI